ncbi:hypothetical protein P7K49_038557 [Saguinus oedipus]|uniref:Uncharacterized protein n=1 Tax=Saguinus oedipus TaxID=9490 RepID=A0ABQ9TF12_SAGOE|nr:hypothetical protein P7K49_038557 [Saguinus oedipus]
MLFRAGRGSSGSGAGQSGASSQQLPRSARRCRGGGGCSSDAEPVGAVREAASGAWPQRGEAWGLKAAAAAMPLLFLERFPWPSLHPYTGLSGLALLGTIVSTYCALSQSEARPSEPAPLTASLLPEQLVPARPSTGVPGPATWPSTCFRTASSCGF